MVYILLLNYNGWRDTIECVESLFKLSSQNFKIIIVDNKSIDNSVEEINKWAINFGVEYAEISEDDTRVQDVTFHFKLLVIKANDNRGFAAGNNIALNIIRCQLDFEYVWLLNNDTIVDTKALDAQIKLVHDNLNSKIGIVGSKILFYYKRDTIQNIGLKYDKKFCLVSEVGNYQHDNEKFDVDNLNIQCVCGASMLITKNFLMDVGLLDEDYFLYYEEPDLCERGTLKGYNFAYCSKSIIYHKHGSSIKVHKNKKSILSDINAVRSKIIFSYKNCSDKKIFLWIGVFYTILKRLMRLDIKRALKLVSVAIKTYESIKK